MKLVFRDLNNLEVHLGTTPSFNFTDTGCRSASFSMDQHVDVEDGVALTGVIDFMSDDDMFLNSFTVEDFLRYTFNNNEDSAYLYLTCDPIPEPQPEPDPPTEEELLEQAKAGRQEQIYETMNMAIVNGIDVETSYGMEHFRLNESDRTLLMGIYSMMQQGITAYPYHSISPQTDSNNICTVYSDEDFGKIATAAFAHVTYHESYANMLVQWLLRETDVDTVYTIQYGATLPEDLMDYLAMILASAGIPAYLIPGYAETHPEETETGTDESGESSEGGDTDNSGEGESADTDSTEEVDNSGSEEGESSENAGAPEESTDETEETDSEPSEESGEDGSEEKSEETADAEASEGNE